MSSTIADAIESAVANQIERDQATMIQHIEEVEQEQKRLYDLLIALESTPSEVIVCRAMMGDMTEFDAVHVLSSPFRNDDTARRYVLGIKALASAKEAEAKAEQARLERERIERERQESLQAWLAGVTVTNDLPAGIDKIVVSFTRTDTGITSSITYSGHNNTRAIKQAKANGVTDPDSQPRKKSGGRSTKVIVQGVEYSSFTSACKALGIPTGREVNERKSLERHAREHNLSVIV